MKITNDLSKISTDNLIDLSDTKSKAVEKFRNLFETTFNYLN